MLARGLRSFYEFDNWRMIMLFTAIINKRSNTAFPTFKQSPLNNCTYTSWQLENCSVSWEHPVLDTGTVASRYVDNVNSTSEYHDNYDCIHKRPSTIVVLYHLRLLKAWRLYSILLLQSLTDHYIKPNLDTPYPNLDIYRRSPNLTTTRPHSDPSYTNPSSSPANWGRLLYHVFHTSTNYHSCYLQH